MAEFSPIAENFTPTGPAPEVSWESALTTPVPGYVDPDVSGSFSDGQSDDPYAFPSIAGAALSVEQSLSKISFVQGTSGQMSSSIAYIRYWSRKGTQQKTSVNYDPVNGSPADPQEALAGNFSAVQSLNVGGNSAIDTNVSGFFQITGENPTAGFVPTNTAYQSQIRQPAPAPATPASPSFLNRLGSIFSANPGGAAAPAWANPFSSRPAAPSPDNAVWQFLFNPEELQLSSGPDFNRAETWGVADPANSGQPLSWRSNKNRKLTFGKVLLHGYTFGRRVDSLEKGLQELFLARDGENGADGPPVLEFVWGQRVFGPCVIQNIQVREKAWDKGLLVNAEVSFDLEQVPEWTINDGFVDVLRPGRQSTINDPSVVSEEYRDTATGETGTGTPPPATKPGGGGGGQQERDPQGSYKACQKAYEFSEIFSQLQIQGDLVKANDRGNNRVQLLRGYINVVEKRYLEAVSSVGVNFTKRISQQESIENLRGSTNSSLVGYSDVSGSMPTDKFIKAVERIMVANLRYKTSMDNVWDKDCKKLIEDGKKAQTTSEKANEKKYLCDNVVANKKCTIGAGEFITNPCSKKLFLCGAKGTYVTAK